MLFITMVLMFAGLIGIKKNEFLPQPKGEYSEIKALGAKVGEEREGNLVYFMLPKFPSYQFLNSIRDHNFRELRDLMVGFYALNNFEIYPNAFVKKNETVSNMIDILIRSIIRARPAATALIRNLSTAGILYTADWIISVWRRTGCMIICGKTDTASALMQCRDSIPASKAGA